MHTATLLPLVRVLTYIEGEKCEKHFAIGLDDNPSVFVPLMQAARYFRRNHGVSLRNANVYFINEVNGTWRTDWKLAPNGTVLPHPWSKRLSITKEVA